MIGQQVGNYRITSVLGVGGMGTVYLAVHPTMGRQAAIKVLHAELAQDPEIVARFLDEARATNAIRHPGIIEIFDLGTLPSGAPYIAMELLQGESLAARLARGGRLPIAEAIHHAGQVARALGAAHAKGIIHRDLKPDNLFLTPPPDGQQHPLLKVLDFGIAKLGDAVPGGGSVRTRTGIVMGTPIYMSPEQCRGTREVDHRSDIYALGIILYEMVCGQPPFQSVGSGELIHLQIAATPAPPRSRNPAVPEELERVILRALDKQPQGRFPSMAAFQAALETVTLGRAATQVASPPPPAGPAPPPVPTTPPTVSLGPSVAGPPGVAAAPRAETTISGHAGDVAARTERRRPLWLFPMVGGALFVAALLVVVLAPRDTAPPPRETENDSAPAAPRAGTTAVEPSRPAPPLAARPARGRQERTTAQSTLEPPPPPPGAPPPAATNLRLRYRHDPGDAPTDQHMRPHFDLVNRGRAAVPLASIEIRYWYRAGRAGGQSFNVDWAALGGHLVRGRFVRLPSPRQGADAYVAVTLDSGGMLRAGRSSGPIQIRVNRDDWAALDERGDYSYLDTTSFVEQPAVTVYLAGALVWGLEP